MNLVYYKAENGNFGDDLNPWLWPKLLGDFNGYPDIDFVGIGSIFDARLEDGRSKLIFGSGVRNFLFNPKNRSQFDIRFVRGPISAKAVGDCKFITDSAYALGLIDFDNSIQKKHDLSFMPYFSQVNGINWKFFEKISGIKVILPTEPVETVIKEISESNKLITNAMHGAIVADVFRVPWIRCKPNSVVGEDHLTSETKWSDWLLSMELDSYAINLNFDLNERKGLRKLQDVERMAKLVRRFQVQDEFFLSKDIHLQDKLQQIAEEIRSLKKIVNINF